MASFRDRSGLLQELERRQQEALAALDELERELAEVIRQWTLPDAPTPSEEPVNSSVET